MGGVPFTLFNSNAIAQHEIEEHDLKMTGSAGSLKVIFYDIVKAHIERKGNKIAGKGLVLDTQLNLESTIGKTLFVSANGPTGKCYKKTSPDIFQSPFDFLKNRRSNNST